MDFKRIGENIDIIRKERGWSQHDVAQRVNTYDSAVGLHIKTGRMSLEMLGRYADGMGCSIADLTDGVTNPEDFHLEADILSYYPYNLIAAIWVDTHRLRIPEVRQEALEKAYATYVPALYKSMEELTDREQRVLKMRFDNGMTLEQVGKVFGVSRDRIRQIEAKALRKLRHPRRCRAWLMDTQGKAYQLEIEKSALQLEVIKLKERLEAIGYKEPEPLNVENSIFEKDIEDMELSVRSFNCLRRAGIYKIGDLYGKTIEDLMHMRNLGRRSAIEIQSKAKEFGIEIKYEGEE